MSTNIVTPPRLYRPPSVYGSTTSPNRIARVHPRPYRPPSVYSSSEYRPRRLDFDTVTWEPTIVDKEKIIVLPACNKQCECTICMTEEEECSSSTGELPCGHAFHTHCIQKWFNNKNTCPNCRAVVDVQSLMQ